MATQVIFFICLLVAAYCNAGTLQPVPVNSIPDEFAGGYTWGTPPSWYDGMTVLDIWTSATYIPNAHTPMPVDGTVVAWTVYVLAVDPVYLQVWRPMRWAYQTGIMELVGQTIINPASPGQIHLSLDSDSQIAVKQGDVIGYHFPTASTVPFERDYQCDDEKDWMYYRRTVGYSVGSNDVYFSNDPAHLGDYLCRHYAFSAEIKNATTTS